MSARVDGPTTAVSAATVTIRRDAASTSSRTPAASADAESATEPDAAPPAEEPVMAPVAEEHAPATLHAAEPVDEPASAAAVVASGTADADAALEPAAASVTESVSESATNARAAVAPVATPTASARPAPGPVATAIISILSIFGLLPNGPPVPVDVVGLPVQPQPGTSATAGVTGVVVGSSSVPIPVGASTYTGGADWYFPTRADGTVRAQGVTWLEHGFLGSRTWYSALAQQLAQQTNNVVVVTDVPSFGFFTCGGCTLNSAALQQGVATLFADPDRAALTASAAAAGYHGVLPENFVLAGHSAGGGLATAAGGFYVDAVPPNDGRLLGVVMFDGVSSNGTFADAVTRLAARNIPVYQIAAPPQPWNAFGQTTKDLVAVRAGAFVGTVLANGSHVDSLIGGSPLVDLVSQLLIKPSPPGNTQAVYTLATGWINDMYAGRGPADGVYGTYGQPSQYVTLGQAAGVVLGPPPVVDVASYLGTWYEVGSVKQFFSFGLVNTTARYDAHPDGSIRVENSGDLLVDGGPPVRIVGTALPVDATNAKLNVTFFGPPAATPPGNYWIVDLAPDYGWAVVTDPSGGSGFLLSRTRTVSDQLYRELLDRASVAGVTGPITRTAQPAAEREVTAGAPSLAAVL